MLDLLFNWFLTIFLFCLGIFLLTVSVALCCTFVYYLIEFMEKEDSYNKNHKDTH